jgi:hypothetical protein
MVELCLPFCEVEAAVGVGTSQETRDRGRVNAEQAGRVRSRLPASGDHPHNLGLLLVTQLGRPPANAPLPAGGLQEGKTRNGI